MASVKAMSKLIRAPRQTYSALLCTRRTQSTAANDPQSLNKPKKTATPLSPNTRAQHTMTQAEMEHNYLPPLPKDPTPSIPMKGSYTSESCDIRREWVEEFSKTKLFNSATFWPEGSDHNTEKLKGNIERPIGMVKIPLAVAGPMYFQGEHADGWFLAPMATTEGALVASVCRGAKAITMSGGVKTWATQQRMTRAPMFFCADPIQANLLGEWVVKNKDRIQEEVVSRFSKRAKLREIIPAYDLDACHTLLRYETGDAAGQNMTTVCSWETAKWVAQVAPRELGIDIRFHCVEGNMCADKKCSAMNALMGRGVSVSAQVDIPENIIQGVLGLTSDTLTEAVFYSHRISERIGQQAGFNVNVANVLGGMFTALGQDIACVHESAISRVDFVKRHHPDGGVRATMYIPSLVVGTVGGGTKLPTQRECLEIIDCYGVGKVKKLAEIICGYCLALDLSTYSAVMGGHFADAHDRLGRNRPDEK